MNKIWVVAGVILFLVLMLGAWLFIVDFGGYSQFLGKKTKEAVHDEPLRFVGTRNAPEEFGTITFFATQKYRRGIEDGAWKLQDSHLLLYGEDTIQPWVTYEYAFSENDTMLGLTNIVTLEHILFTKQ